MDRAVRERVRWKRLLEREKDSFLTILLFFKNHDARELLGPKRAANPGIQIIQDNLLLQSLQSVVGKSRI